jgi:hypothetical protein
MVAKSINLTPFLLSIICYIGKFYLKDIFLNCYFQLFWENFMKTITARQSYLQIMIYQCFLNNQLNLCDFYFRGT